jgi:cell wall-associated NlpC family hydrolase
MVLMPVKSSYLLFGAGGAVLLWSGFKGKKVTSAVRDLISGRNPEAQPLAYPIVTSSAAYAYGGGVAASPVGSVVGKGIAVDAEQYKGAGYVWGGAPARGIGNRDCSSFANWVIGHDMGLAIPLYKAGTYTGNSHGPPTGVWLLWTGAFNIARRDAAAGDLAVWQTHMGIVIDNNHMISALDSQLGTQITTIEGGAPTAEKLFIRRLKAVTPGG